MTAEILNLLENLSRNTKQRYDALYADAKEDPGSSGDNGEKIWANILAEWLPPIFDVRTKARILNRTGDASPQIDIVVLSPFYPSALKKDTIYYLASGVVAAFECKNTLRAGHIKKFFENARKISGLIPIPPHPKNVAQVLRPPVLYGLLAHSHEWKSPGSAPFENLSRNISAEFNNQQLTSPRQIPSLICTADVGSWISSTQFSRLSTNTLVSTMHTFQHLQNSATSKESRYDPLNAFLVDLYIKFGIYFPPMELGTGIVGDLQHYTSEINHQQAYQLSGQRQFASTLLPDKLIPTLEDYLRFGV